MATKRRDYAPTPWMNVTHPINALAYKFRLERTRAGGKIYVKFHKESPAGANEVRGVLPSRSMWYEWVQAAERLLSTSQRYHLSDPSSPHPIFEWNQNKRDYVAFHGEDMDKVAFALPNLLDPKLGPPYKLERITVLSQPGASFNTTHVRARNNRYAEIVITMRDVLTRIKSLHERMQDARRMKGYDKGEVNVMYTQLSNIKSIAEDLRRMAMTNTFKPSPATTQNLATPLNLDFDEGADSAPLSPAEQRIAEELRVNEDEEEKQRLFDEAQWAKIKDSMWKGDQPKGFTVVPEDGQ